MSLNKRLISVEKELPGATLQTAFQTVLYTGNRPSNVTVNTFGFSPDLVAIKDRDNADHWSVLDSTRGQNVIGFNQTGAQSDFSGGFEFTSGGFMLGHASIVSIPKDFNIHSNVGSFEHNF